MRQSHDYTRNALWAEMVPDSLLILKCLESEMLIHIQWLILNYLESNENRSSEATCVVTARVVLIKMTAFLFNLGHPQRLAILHTPK